jgi:hypothetical protein
MEKQVFNPKSTLIWAGLQINTTLWLFNIAMENGPFIDGLPMKNGDFPWLTVK